MTTPDPLDQPEEPRYALAYPFVVCQSKGGPHEDQAFVAGFQCGDIDRALTATAAAGGDRATFTVRTALVEQLELIAMYRGFPNVAVVSIEDMPEWSVVSFAASKEADQP